VASNYTPQELGEWVDANLTGCSFVGVANDGEVFLRFDNEDASLQSSQSEHLRKRFPDIPKVTVVVQPSLEQVKQMVDDLNELLKQKEEPKPDLLDLEDF
jgi:hypothetical protein